MSTCSRIVLKALPHCSRAASKLISIKITGHGIWEPSCGFRQLSPPRSAQAMTTSRFIHTTTFPARTRGLHATAGVFVFLHQLHSVFGLKLMSHREVRTADTSEFVNSTT